MRPHDDGLSPELLALIDRYHAAQAESRKAVAVAREALRAIKADAAARGYERLPFRDRAD